MSKRLEGGYLGGRPTWSLGSNPGIWAVEQVYARRAAGAWPVGAGSFDEYYEYVTFMLHANGANASTSFPDSSLYGRAVTVSGNAQVSTAQSKFGGASAYFDGTGDYLTCASSNAFLLGGSDNFTIEAWVYANSTAGTGVKILASTCLDYNTNFLNRWLLGISGNNLFWLGSDGNAAIIDASAFPVGQWVHVAAVRNAGVISLYKAGSSLGTQTLNQQYTTDAQLSVGFIPNALAFNGYIDEFRITKGYARYTSNFSVPTGPYEDEGAPLADPFYSYVNLLLPMNGSNNSTTFTDRSPNALNIVSNNGAKLSTTQKRFGASSAYFDGTDDYLSTSISGGLGSGDFTLEFWYYKTFDSGMLFNSRSGGTGGDGIDIRHDLQVTTAGQIITNGVTVSTNAWHHVAIVRSGSTLTRYIDGTANGTFSITTNFSNSTISIGGNTGGNVGYLTGYIDDFRITKGIARYTANFIPPLPHADYGTLVDPYLAASTLWMPMEGPNNSTGFFDRADRLPVTTYGNAKISNAQYKWGLASAYFDGSGDYLEVPLASATGLDFGTGDWTVEFWMYYTGTANQYPVVLTNNPGSWTAGAVTIAVDHAWAVNKLAVSANSHSTTVPVVSSTTTLNLGQWYHCAVIRSGTTIRIFVDGIDNGSATISGSLAFNFSTGGAKVGGGNWDGASSYFAGYIDDLRIIKGYARYTTNFTPPTAPINADTSSDPYLSNVSLLLKMDGENNSTTFTDSSLTPKAVFVNGDAKISTAQSKFGGSSALFDGSGDGLTIPTADGFDFGTGDFTIELWVNATTWSGADRGIATKGWTTAAFGAWLIYYDNTNNRIAFYSSSNNTSWDIASAVVVLSAPQVNRWYHIAVTRSGSTFRTFVDGAQTSTFTSSASLVVNAAHNIGIGADRTGVTAGFAGYIDDLRITKGVARYTANFLPPTIGHPVWSQTDASFSSVSLLLRGNGKNGNAIFTDRSSKTLTVFPNGNAQNSTAQSRFSGSSLYFDGAGDFLTTADVSELEPGSQDLTWEMWIKTANNTQYATLYSRTPSTFSSGMWSLMMNYASSTAGDLALFVGDYSTSLPLLATSGVNVRDDVWHHVAVVRNGTEWRIYVDGTSRAVVTWSGTIADISGSIYVGRDQFYTRDYTGYIDDLRITKGVARYTANFTPPVAPHPVPISDPSAGATVLLLHMEGANASTYFPDYSYSGLTVTASGNAAVSTAQSKFGGSSAYFDGTGDWLTASPASPDLVFGTQDFTLECFFRLQSVPANIYGEDAQIIFGNSSGLGEGMRLVVEYNLLTARKAAYTVAAGKTWATNTWYHVAFCRSGTTAKLFLDGTLVNTATWPVLNMSDATDRIGCQGDGSGYGNRPFRGWIDEVRITKGIARYSSSFTPPTGPYLL